MSGPRSGFYYTLAGVPLMIAGVVAPDVFHVSMTAKTAIFFLCMAAAFVMLLIGTIKEVRGEAAARSEPGYRRRMIAVWGMLLCGLGFIGFAMVYFWPAETPIPSIKTTVNLSEPSASPKDRSLKDFSNAELREAAIRFASQLRTFAMNAERDMPLPEMSAQPRTREEALQQQNQYLKKSMEYVRQMRLAFSNDYLGRAQQFRDVIISRLASAGIFPPFLTDDVTGTAMVRGYGRIVEMDATTFLQSAEFINQARQIREIADYIEWTARRIPD